MGKAPKSATRSFNGEIYRYAGWTKTKKQAEKHAKNDRNDGYMVRIVKQKDQYTLYRKK